VALDRREHLRFVVSARLTSSASSALTDLDDLRPVATRDAGASAPLPPPPPRGPRRGCCRARSRKGSHEVLEEHSCRSVIGELLVRGDRIGFIGGASTRVLARR
jgi:hypothetical protein